MESTTLRVGNVEELSNGEHKLQVMLVDSAEMKRLTGTARLFNSVVLPPGIRNVARLDDAAFVNETAGTWLATHGGEWTREAVQEYLEHILQS